MLDSGSEDDLFTNMVLREAIQELDPVRKAVISLRAAGYTQQECGTILGLTGVAVGLIYRKTVLQLRQYFDWYERKAENGSS